MSVRLSVAVMHHPSRAAELPGLLHLLDDGRHRVQVITDTWGEGLWKVASTAWGAWSGGATHHMVVQDDVLPCRDFLRGAENALAARPTDPVSFYCARKVQREAIRRGSPWCSMGTISGAPCIAMPVGDVERWLAWCRVWVRADFRPDDARLSLWLLHHARRIYYTCPSLVEHIGWDRSLRGHPKSTGGKARIAECYIGSDATALGIDWTRSVAVPHDSGVSISAYKGWRR